MCRDGARRGFVSAEYRFAFASRPFEHPNAWGLAWHKGLVKKKKKLLVKPLRERQESFSGAFRIETREANGPHYRQKTDFSAFVAAVRCVRPREPDRSVLRP
jgi:hypothetical protein